MLPSERDIALECVVAETLARSQVEDPLRRLVREPLAVIFCDGQVPRILESGLGMRYSRQRRIPRTYTRPVRVLSVERQVRERASKIKRRTLEALVVDGLENLDRPGSCHTAPVNRQRSEEDSVWKQAIVAIQVSFFLA